MLSSVLHLNSFKGQSTRAFIEEVADIQQSNEPSRLIYLEPRSG